MTEEDKKRTFELFCDQCNLQTTARVVATHVETEPENRIQALTDPVDTPYYVTEYAIALCSKCYRIFLVQSDFYEIPGEVCVPQGVSVLYPVGRNISTDGMPETASRAYTAAARSYQVGLYEPWVIMCRKCIEALCRELGATKGNLKECLSRLRQSGHIPVFSATSETRKGKRLYEVVRLSSLGIRRYLKFKADANPYQQEYAAYFWRRRHDKEARLLSAMSSWEYRSCSQTMEYCYDHTRSIPC